MPHSKWGLLTTYSVAINDRISGEGFYAVIKIPGHETWVKEEVNDWRID